MVYAPAVNLPVLLYGEAQRAAGGVSSGNVPVVLAVGLEGSAGHADDQVLLLHIGLCAEGRMLAQADRTEDGVKLRGSGPVQRIIITGAGLAGARLGHADENPCKTRGHRCNAVLGGDLSVQTATGCQC